MSTITAILAPDADGTLHLPVPVEWRKLFIKVKAELEPVRSEAESETAAATLTGIEALKGVVPLSPSGAPQPGCLKGFWMAPDFDEPLEDFKEYME